MAQGKARRQKQVPRVKSAAGLAVRPEPQTADHWRRECERLRGELATAREEIANLKTRQEQVLNRIDWVLDSLDSLSEIES